MRMTLSALRLQSRLKIGEDRSSMRLCGDAAKIGEDRANALDSRSNRLRNDRRERRRTLETFCVSISLLIKALKDSVIQNVRPLSELVRRCGLIVLQSLQASGFGSKSSINEEVTIVKNKLQSLENSKKNIVQSQNEIKAFLSQITEMLNPTTIARNAGFSQFGTSDRGQEEDTTNDEV
ncbi:uncharacterized protein LOC120267385 [Dioscorea cayenensis subsp. rotundata]|uniref:Uncharacterized protein LOC120267385 n=1 Tax=Dioscorea cayennensis subsp. rotundata TaxID=55577 RepID=A0AB40BU35_DIOCR|nr:uncharacterized protein LOC120267385 [Dioscorea cayenensis subsp. rotundata]